MYKVKYFEDNVKQEIFWKKHDFIRASINIRNLIYFPLVGILI